MTKTSEPDITINGQKLTEAQAMTVRVALSDFYTGLEAGLGDDEHGKRMTAAYRARLEELFRIITP